MHNGGGVTRAQCPSKYEHKEQGLVGGKDQEDRDEAAQHKEKEERRQTESKKRREERMFYETGRANIAASIEERGRPVVMALGCETARRKQDCMSKAAVSG